MATMCRPLVAGVDCNAGFRVALYARHRFMTDLVPNDFSCGLVQRDQPPLVWLLVIGGSNVAVKSHLQIGLARSRRCRHVNAVVPDDRRGMRESGKRRAPTDVLAFLNIPTRWNRRTRIHSAGLGSAELRPVGCRQIDCGKESEEKRGCVHD